MKKIQVEEREKQTSFIDLLRTFWGSSKAPESEEDEFKSWSKEHSKDLQESNQRINDFEAILETPKVKVATKKKAKSVKDNVQPTEHDVVENQVEQHSVDLDREDR